LLNTVVYIHTTSIALFFVVSKLKKTIEMPSIKTWLVSGLYLASFLGNAAAAPLPEDDVVALAEVAGLGGSCRTVIRRKEWFVSLAHDFSIYFLFLS
jgi:hypothetical protein